MLWFLLIACLVVYLELYLTVTLTLPLFVIFAVTQLFNLFVHLLLTLLRCI
jgi:hypothetical protein